VEYQCGGTDNLREFGFEGLGDNVEFIQLLRSAQVKTIHSQEASLDRVFADVTGVRLDSEGV
jgi:fluoroquinolone transport system ATP-binding protein